MAEVQIDIDLDKTCPECGRPGSVNGGVCLECAAKKMSTLDEPEFLGDWAEADPSVIHIAQQMIQAHHPWLRSAKIGFLYRKEAPLKNGKYTLGQAQKVNSRLQPFMDYDFLIWIAKDAWDRMESARREALIDHELCHCVMGDNGWKVRGHEIEEFSEIIERHGFWTYDLMKVQKIAVEQAHLPGLEPAGGVEAVRAQQFSMIDEEG